MPDFAEPLARLITEFKRLPGIGQKSAQRLAFHVLRGGREDAERLTVAILDVKDKLGLCKVCNNISDAEECQFCRDTTRDPKVICVVEEPHDIVGIETTRQRTNFSRSGLRTGSSFTRSSSNLTHSSHGMHRRTTTIGLPDVFASENAFGRSL